MTNPALTIAALMAGMALATTASAQDTPVNPTGKAMPQPEASTTAPTSGGADASATAKADLAGVKTGQTVKDAAGATLGTVSRIDHDEAGGVKSVTVSGADGKTHTLMPGALSVSGDVVTTTAAAH